MEKKKIHISGKMPCSLALSHIDCFLEGLRDGSVVVEQGTEKLVLHPHAEINMDIEARTKGDRQRLVITLDWNVPETATHGHEESHHPHTKHTHGRCKDSAKHLHAQSAGQHDELYDGYHGEHHVTDNFDHPKEYDEHGFHSHYHCHGKDEHQLCHSHEHAGGHHEHLHEKGCCEDREHEPHKGCCAEHNYGKNLPAHEQHKHHHHDHDQRGNGIHVHGYKGCCEERKHAPHAGCCSEHNYGQDIDTPKDKGHDKVKHGRNGKKR